jgi:hypothetical protein
MAVARRQRIQEGSPTEAPKRAGPRRVQVTDAPGAHPLADQLLRLEEAFSQEEAEHGPRYSGKVRLAILVGAPLALWVALAGAAMGLRALF